MADIAVRDFSAGLIDKLDTNLLPDNAAQDVQNFLPRSIGSLRKRKGQERLNSSDLGGPIQGLYPYYYGIEQVNRRLMVALNGVVGYFNGETFSKLKDFNVVPIMTGYTTPEGEASASKEYEVYPAWQAFDSDSGTLWGNDYGMPCWLAYEFTTPIVITAYEIHTYHTQAPVDFLFQGSHDGIVWVTLDEREGQALKTATARLFSANNNTAYKHYRIYITKSSSASSYLVIIRTLKFFAPANPMFFETCVNYLVGFDGVNAPWKWDGGVHSEGIVLAHHSDSKVFKAEGEFAVIGEVIVYVNGEVVEDDLQVSNILGLGTVTFDSAQETAVVGEEPSTEDNKTYYTEYIPIKENSATVSVDGVLKNVDAEGFEHEIVEASGAIIFEEARETEVKNELLTTEDNLVYSMSKGNLKPDFTLIYRETDGIKNLITSGFTIDTADGEVTFEEEQTDDIYASFVWVSVITIDYTWVHTVAVDASLGQTPLKNAPADGQFPILHKEKLFVVSKSDPSAIRWSDSFQPEQWPGLNYWAIKDGDGDEITSLQKYLGELFIFKNRSIHTLRGTSLDDMRLDEIDSKIGCVGPRAITVRGSQLFFIGYDGIYTFNGMTATNISRERIPKLWGTINKEMLHKAVVTTWDGMILFAFPQGESETNNLIIALVTGESGGSFWPFKGINASCYSLFDDGEKVELYAGDSLAGYVNRQDIGYSDSGEPIKAYWTGKAYDLGAAEYEKKAKKAFVQLSPNSQNHPDLFASLDYEHFTQLDYNRGDRMIEEYKFEGGKRWRYLTPKLAHNAIGECEIRGLLIPVKAKRRPKVRGEW